MQDKFEYSLRYFELHAEQRMSTFNFFIVLSGLLITSLVSTFDKEFTYPSAGYVISLSMIYISCIFWKLDQRVSFLVKHAEKSLSWLEKLEISKDPDYPDIFTAEEIETSKCEPPVWPGFFRAKMRYSQCFNALYLLFCAIGFFGLIARSYLDFFI